MRETSSMSFEDHTKLWQSARNLVLMARSAVGVQLRQPRWSIPQLIKDIRVTV